MTGQKVAGVGLAMVVVAFTLDMWAISIPGEQWWLIGPAYLIGALGVGLLFVGVSKWAAMPEASAHIHDWVISPYHDAVMCVDCGLQQLEDEHGNVVTLPITSSTAILEELRKRIHQEWDECEHYDKMRATDCDDANLDYHGPSIIYCGALKWVLAEIDRLAQGQS